MKGNSQDSEPSAEDVREQLATALVEVGAVEFGDFTLASGRRSDVYVNIKRATTRPAILRLCAKAMAEHVGGADRVAGVELGAIPLAVAVSLETGLPFIMVRKKPKDHGTQSLLEGELEPADEVVLVEDVTTTAGSAARAVEVLRESGARVDRVVVVIDRGEGATETLAAAGAKLIAILTLADLRKRAQGSRP
jgi:orotate phosphoribosyltransferase